MDSLVEKAIPGLAFAEFKGSIAVCIPFFEEDSSAILLAKVGTESLFEAATEDHRCPCLFFPPPIQVTVAIAARTTQVLTDLRVAIDHRCRPAHCCGPMMCIRAPPSLPRGRRHRGFGKRVRSDLYKRSGQPREDCGVLFHRPGHPSVALCRSQNPEETR